MRELEVLGDGHLKLRFADWKDFFEQELVEQVRAQLKALLDCLLNFFAVPSGHWKKVRTTNVIERAFREVRRRTRPMSSFKNLASCDRVVFGVVSHLNRSWERKPLPEFTQNP